MEHDFQMIKFIEEENNNHDNKHEKVKFNDDKDDLNKTKLHSEVDNQPWQWDNEDYLKKVKKKTS